MEISIHKLHDDYCQELNRLWIEAISSFNGSYLQYDNLKNFIKGYREAERLGYSFILSFDSLNIINECSIDLKRDEHMLSAPGWNDITVINKMKEESEKNKWLPIDPYLDQLRIEKIKSLSTDFLEKNSRTNGPFYPGKDASSVYVYCRMGHVALEIAFLSVVVQSKNVINERQKK